MQTWKPKKFKEKLIGNHKETQKTLKISGLFHFTRLVISFFKAENGIFRVLFIWLKPLPQV